MQDLAGRLWRPGARWHVGDLAWGRFQHVGREPDWRTSLWADGDTTVAWAWHNGPSELELLVDPDHVEVLPEVLAWFDSRAAVGEPPTVHTVDIDQAVTTALREAGYAPGPADDPYAVHLHIDLDQVPAEPPTLPEGYRLDHVSDVTLTARVDTHREAFDPSRVTVDSYRQVRACWPYREDLDVVVLDAGGTVVSYALAWYDDRARVGLLEPVGTRPAHRRRGLAGAACTEALRRLRAAGARTATIAARGDDAYPEALRVYTRVGFRPVSRDVAYVRARRSPATDRV
jgi:predicted N-acetyltransferase YhbS